MLQVFVRAHCRSNVCVRACTLDRCGLFLDMYFLFLPLLFSSGNVNLFEIEWKQHLFFTNLISVVSALNFVVEGFIPLKLVLRKT